MNKVKEVCELLGVEVDEEFKVKDYGDSLYGINYEGSVLVRVDEEWQTSRSLNLRCLISGDAEIVKQWRPVVDEYYFIVDFSAVMCCGKYEFVHSIEYKESFDSERLIELKKANLLFDNPKDAQKRAYEIIGRD